MTEIGLFEAIRSCPIMRRLKQDPVEEEKLVAILEAANFAPSGRNAQPWEFIVIKDPSVKRRLGVLAAKGSKVLSEIGAISSDSPEMRPGLQRSRQLIEDYEKVPFLIMICFNKKRAMAGIRLRVPYLFKHVSRAGGLRRLQRLGNYGSIFPALQNLILAARGLGLGAPITMTSLIFEKEVKRLLGIPPYVEPMAMVAVGYPKGRFVTPKRRPWTEMVHYNHF